MAIRLTCPCGKQLRTADDAAGKRVKCPRCGTSLEVPEVSDRAVPHQDASRRRPLWPWFAGGAVLVALVVVAVVLMNSGSIEPDVVELPPPPASSAAANPQDKPRDKAIEMPVKDEPVGEVQRLTFPGAVAAISDDGRRVVVRSASSAGLHVWDLASGKELHRLEKGTAPVALTRDGKLALSHDGDGLRLWEVDTGATVRKFRGDINPVMHLTFSPDARWALSTNYDGKLYETRLWDVASGEERLYSDVGLPKRKVEGAEKEAPTQVATLPLMGNGPSYLLPATFLPDSRRFTPYGDRYWFDLPLWDVQQTKQAGSLKRSQASIQIGPFLPNGKHAVFWLNYRPHPGAEEIWEAGVYDLEKGTILRQFLLQDLRAARNGTISNVALSEDGCRAVSIDRGALRLWHVETGKELYASQVPMGNQVAMLPDGRRCLLISVRSADGVVESTIIRWRLPDGNTPAARPVNPGEGEQPTVPKFFLKRVVPETQAAPDAIQRLKVSGPVLDVSRDGRLAVTSAVSADDPDLRVWDLESGKELHALKGHPGGIKQAVFSPDGKSVLSGKTFHAVEDHHLRLWDAASGKLVRRFEGHSKLVWSVAFSPDGSHAVSGGVDETCRLWDVASGKELRKFTLKRDYDGVPAVVYHAAFLPDGRRVLINGKHLWDAKTGEQLRMADRPTGLERWSPGQEGHRVFFFPDGRKTFYAFQYEHIIPGNQSMGQIRNTITGGGIWDMQAGKTTAWAGGIAAMTCVAFSADGRHALIGHDSNVLLCDAAGEKVLHRFVGHAGVIERVSFEADGKHILSVAVDGFNVSRTRWALPLDGL